MSTFSQDTSSGTAFPNHLLDNGFNGTYGGSFTRIKDDNKSLRAQEDAIVYGFDRIRVYEPNPPKEQQCNPSKTLHSGAHHPYTQASIKDTTADVDNYLKRPMAFGDHSIGTQEHPKVSEKYSELNLNQIYEQQKDCAPFSSNSSILNDPKENYRGLSTLHYNMNQLYTDPQAPVTHDDFTRPMQSRQLVKDIYKQQVCANSCNKRTSFINGKKETLANDYAVQMCKQELKRKTGPNSILLGTARFETVNGRENTGPIMNQFKPGFDVSENSNEMLFDSSQGAFPSQPAS